MGTVAQFRRYVGDTMQNLVSMLGTERDKSYHNQYTLNQMDRGQLDAAYRGDWVAKKIVNVPAKDATREGRNWQAKPNEIELIEAEEKRLGLLHKLKWGMIKSRLYGGGALLIGLGDDAAQPINLNNVQKGSLKYLHAVACHDLKDGDVVEDVNDPDFGLPEFYTLNPIAGQSAEVKIHRSRVVRLIGEPYPDRQTVGVTGSWGDSVLQAVNDAVMNVAVSSGAVAYLMQEMKLDVVKIPDFMKNMADPAYKASIIERFALANQTKSLTSTLIMDREEEWDRVEATFAGLPDVMKLYLLIASGAADIPATRLLGQSAVGLNATGDGDLRNYYDHIAAEQRTVLTPALATLDEILIRSALGSRPKEIWYQWAPLWQTSDTENAALAKTKAETTKIYVDTGMIDPGILEKVVFNQLVEDGHYPGIEAAKKEWEAEGGGVDEEDPEVKAQFNELKGKEPEDEEDTPEARRAKLKVVGEDGMMTHDQVRRLVRAVMDEFNEESVERDDDGKFASGGGGGERAKGDKDTRSGPISPSAEAAAKELGLSTEYKGTDAPEKQRSLVVDNPLPVTDTVSYEQVHNDKTLLKGPSEEKEVPLSSLKTVQDYVFPERVAQYMDDGKSSGAFLTKGGVAVATLNGQRVIIDGTHRAVASKLKGEKSIKIKDYGSFTLKSGSFVKDAAPRTLYVRRDLMNGAAVLAHFQAQLPRGAVLQPASLLHVTLAYSKAPVDWAKLPADWYGSEDEKGWLRIRPGGMRMMERLGAEDPRAAVVMQFASTAFTVRWNDLKDAGCSWDFDDFQAHVTIAWDKEQAIDVSSLKPWQGELVFGPEVWEEVDENWKAKSGIEE